MQQLSPILLIAQLFSCEKSSTEMSGVAIPPSTNLFIPKDFVIGNNFFQVKFSSDCKSSYTTPTTLSNYILTSFEPFTVNNKTYGAYQVYENNGTTIPGTSKGEIWLKGILGDTTHQKISTYNGVAVDPEYVTGNKKVWIYYYGKSVGSASVFDLHRCETPLLIP